MGPFRSDLSWDKCRVGISIEHSGSDLLIRGALASLCSSEFDRGDLMELRWKLGVTRIVLQLTRNDNIDCGRGAGHGKEECAVANDTFIRS